jgi:mono/diheme cytochrome c family protein
VDPNVLMAAGSVLLLIGFIGFFAFLIKHQEEVEPDREVYGVELLRQHYEPGQTIEQPTPYFVSPIPAAPDPLEISSNLDKKIVTGAAMIFFVFAVLGGYLVIQPAIRARASDEQLDKAIHRGRNLYANFCFDCHGETGQGIAGAGLPLNQPGNKAATLASDPQKLKDRELLLRRTIERGRAKPLGTLSMPAWGDQDGGTLNDEQVNQLLAFLEYGKDDDWHDIVTIRQESDLPTKPNTPKPEVVTGPAGGKRLTTSNPQQTCVTCHSFVKDQPSLIPQAPNLSNYGNEGPINDELKRLKASGEKDWLTKWVSNAPSIKPGIAMPTFALSAGGQLTDDNIKALVEYLQTLGTPNEPK